MNIAKYSKYKNKYLGLKEITENNGKQLIILTTPHEKCPNYKHTHLCDFFAIKLANQLLESLKDETTEVMLFSGNINRSVVDLNRIAGRNTEYRKNVKNTLLKKIKNSSFVTYVLDCHSFPPGDSFQNIRTTNPDVTILFDDCKSQLLIIDELIETFRDNNILAIKLIGINNDIIDEYNSIKIPNRKIIPVLIELNENVDDDKLKIIGKCINIWIKTINKYYS